MKKHRFIIVGSGWRSLCYVRIAKALSEVFDLCAMFCRTEEKAERMARENNIYTTTSIEECKAMKPDFVVVVVNKTSIADVSKEWRGYGFTVLCETPAAMDTETLNELWTEHRVGGRLMVAVYEFDSEQYRSPIRNNYVKLQGVRGEMKDNTFYWLDEENEPKKAQLVASEVPFTRDSDNPNLQVGSECKEIRLVQDAYMAILMKQAVETGEVVASKVQSWQEGQVR